MKIRVAVSDTDKNGTVHAFEQELNDATIYNYRYRIASILISTIEDLEQKLKLSLSKENNNVKR